MSIIGPLSEVEEFLIKDFPGVEIKIPTVLMPQLKLLTNSYGSKLYKLKNNLNDFYKGKTFIHNNILYSSVFFNHDCIYLNNDWKYLGEVDFSSSIPVYNLFPGATIDYPPMFAYCDHCESRKPKIKTYLLKNNEDRIIQVGRGCLNNFLGSDPKDQLRCVKIIEEMHHRIKNSFIELASIIELEPFLAIVNNIVEKKGFISKKEAYEKNLNENTASLATTDYLNKKEITEEDKETAKKAIKYVLSINNNDLYLVKLKIICENNSFLKPDNGYAASIIQYYRNYLMNNYNGPYVGTKDTKYIANVKLLNQKDVFNNFGPSTFYKFLVLQTNSIIVWWNSGFRLKKKIGDEFLLGGKVKDHRLFNGQKTTVMNRCKVLDE